MTTTAKRFRKKATTNLLKLTDKIDTNKMKESSFLMILTATEYAYKNENDICIVPIGCLKP